MIRCLDCRFRAATMGDAGWNGAERCLNSKSPFFGQKIMFDERGNFLADGCEDGKNIVFDKDEKGHPTYSLNCIPPGWIIE